MLLFIWVFVVRIVREVWVLDVNYLLYVVLGIFSYFLWIEGSKDILSNFVFC